METAQREADHIQDQVIHPFVMKFHHQKYKDELSVGHLWVGLVLVIAHHIRIVSKSKFPTWDRS